jgi:GntR family transcriptional regulator / MocR family aminotransferase
MDMHLDLASAPGRSLRARAEHALREAVRSGRLRPGTRLPSTRALAQELGVSRGVLVDAYTQLAAEGYLYARPSAGTVVMGAAAPNDRPVRDVLTARRVRYDLNPFRPALGGFPRVAWLAALTRVMREASDEHLGYPDPAGTIELRTTLAAYLGRVRGVRAEPGRIVITSGVRHGVDLLWSALAAKGASRIGVESPGWAGIHETVADAGLATVPLAVDEHGLAPADFALDDLDAVALAPAHQFPTGAVLKPLRRMVLLDWAQREQRLIVEDDYDAEYRYDRKPIGSLQGLAPEHVVYAGSTSKTLAPALRIGWLVLPPPLVEPVRMLQRRRGAVPAPLMQLAFADLIERGDLDRHLRRQRRSYRRQRDALLEALARALPELKVQGAAAGLYVVLGLPHHTSEQAILADARERGIALEGLGGEQPGLVVGYGNLPESAVAPAVDALAASIRGAMREAAAPTRGSAAQ